MSDVNYPDFPTNPLPAIAKIADIGVANLLSRKHDTAQACWVLSGCGLGAAFPVQPAAANPGDDTPVLRQSVSFNDEEAVRMCQQMLHDVEGDTDGSQKLKLLNKKMVLKLAQWAFNWLVEQMAE